MVELEEKVVVREAPRAERPGERLAELLERRGRRVVEAAGVWWTSVDIGSRYYTSLPDQLMIECSRDEAHDMLRRSGGLLARYPSNEKAALPCGAYVIQDRGYALQKLQKRTRNFVRRGLESCTVRLVERQELLTQGIELNLDTMARHRRKRPEFGDPAVWAKTVDAVYRTRGSECWGAFVGDRLASYVMCCRDAGWEHLLIQMSRAELLKSYPNHAIDYFLIERAMANPEVEGVCLGSLPLRHSEGLHNYKLRMGYGVLPQGAALAMHPLIEPVAKSRLTAAVARRALRWPQLAAMAESVEILSTGVRVSALEDEKMIARELAAWAERRGGRADEGDDNA